MNSRHRPIARAIDLVLLGILATGCASDPTTGWSFESTYPAEFTTVAVPIAQNETFVRDVEFQLTNAIVKQIASATPYRLARESDADTALFVQIRDVQLDELSKSPVTGLGEEVLIGMTIDFEWRNLATGLPLVERQAFTGQALFVPSMPSQERIELGQLAVVERLSLDIVNEMRSGW